MTLNIIDTSIMAVLLNAQLQHNFKAFKGIPSGSGYTLNLLAKDTAAIPDASQ